MHWMHRHRLLILTAICLFWTSLILLAHFTPSIPFLSDVWRGEQSFQDLLRREGRKTPASPELVFVGIDEGSINLSSVGPDEIKKNRAFQLMTAHSFPWSREIWALFLDRMFEAGAKV